MKKAKIYIPAKTAMQSGRGKLKKWVLEFETKDPSINPLMGWETSSLAAGWIGLVLQPRLRVPALALRQAFLRQRRRAILACWPPYILF